VKYKYKENYQTLVRHDKKSFVTIARQGKRIKISVIHIG